MKKYTPPRNKVKFQRRQTTQYFQFLPQKKRKTEEEPEMEQKDDEDSSRE